jgi:hypothetical protein
LVYYLGHADERWAFGYVQVFKGYIRAHHSAN